MSLHQCPYKSVEDVQSLSVSLDGNTKTTNRLFVGTDCECSSVRTVVVCLYGQRVSVGADRECPYKSVQDKSPCKSVQDKSPCIGVRLKDGTKTTMHSFGRVSPSWLCTPSRLGASAGGQSTKQGPPVIRIASNVYIGGKHRMFC